MAYSLMAYALMTYGLCITAWAHVRRGAIERVAAHQLRIRVVAHSAIIRHTSTRGADASHKWKGATMTKIITAKEAADLLSDTKGRIFSVTFVKRTTGETRTMVARTGVAKHLKGGDAAYSFSANALLSVYDLQKKAYRSIPLDGILSLKEGGEEYTVSR